MNHNQPLSEGQAAQLQLDSYVMEINTHLCQCCENGERFSQIYEVWVHPTLTRQTRYHKKIPLFGTKLDPTLQCSVIENIPKPVPYCSDCTETMAKNRMLPTTPISRQAWADTLARKYAKPSVTVPERPEGAARRPTPTLDML